MVKHRKPAASKNTPGTHNSTEILVRAHTRIITTHPTTVTPAYGRSVSENRRQENICTAMLRIRT